MISRGFVLGAAVAVGGLMLVPGVAAAVGRAGRPLVRAAMKTGATAYDEFRKAGAEAYEHMEDIAAEIRAEMHEARAATDDAAADAPGEADGGSERTAGDVGEPAMASGTGAGTAAGSARTD